MIIEIDVKQLSSDGMAKQSLIDILKENECFVSFEKANGETRRMLCTLLPSYMSSYESKGSSKASNDDVIYVWDIESGAFRSFHISSLKRFYAL